MWRLSLTLIDHHRSQRVNQHSVKMNIWSWSPGQVLKIHTRAFPSIKAASFNPNLIFYTRVAHRRALQLQPRSLSSQSSLVDSWASAPPLNVHLKRADLVIVWCPLATHLPCSRKPQCFRWADWPAQCKDQIGSFYLPSGRAASLSALPLEGVYLACW